MGRNRKQIAFDLDTKMLERYYPKECWTHAYDDIKRHMIENGFERKQGSVYVSTHPLTAFDIDAVLKELVENHVWLNKCMRDCKETNVGKEYDKNQLFDKSIEIEPRDKILKKEKN